MNLRQDSSNLQHASKKGGRGAILIIVMWIAFGLICVALYFGQSMAYEMRSADNRVAGTEAEQAIEGAARYIAAVLTNHPGVLPDKSVYEYEDVPVGNARFWIIGRSDKSTAANATAPTFGLTDETGKLNLNSTTKDYLLALPRMTSEMASSILIWTNKNNATSSDLSDGANDQTYASMNPPYTLKSALFETVGELRMVGPKTTTSKDLLFGRDLNLNGITDLNEKNLDVIAGYDAQGGTVDPGLFEFVTVYSQDRNLQTNGTARIIVTNGSDMATMLNQKLSDTAVISALSAPNQPAFTSLLDYYLYHKERNRLTEGDFEKIWDSIALSTNSVIGLVNVNTASRVVLEALGLSSDTVETLISYRQANPNGIYSIAWVATALNMTARANLAQQVPCHAKLTTRTYQISADIAALGLHDRGYRRVRFIFDTSTGVPQIVHRQDLTHLGWALGKDLRDEILNSKELR